MSPRARRRQGAAAAVTINADFKYVGCRAMGHEWHHLPADEPIDGFTPRRFLDPTTRTFASRCLQCETIRVKWITPLGTTGNRYYYQDGYHAAKVKPQDWRREWYVRSL